MPRRSPADYNWSALEFDETILRKHYTSPRRSRISFVVAHHMTVIGTGDGSANTTCFNIWQNREASAHYGVDGQHVRQFVWDRDAAWATGNTTGNHGGISIEHANASREPTWMIANDTWKTGARLAGHLHHVYKLGRPVSGKTLRKHSSFTSTACPGPFFDKIWGEYVAEAQRVYDSLTGVKPTPSVPKPQPVEPKPQPTVNSAGALLVNCASKRSDVGAGSWSKRLPIIAKVILDSEASFIACQELYSGQRPALVKAVSSKYALAGYREGRVLLQRKGRWTTPAGSWWRNLRSGRKPAVVDKFTRVEGGAKLTLFNLHLSYETTPQGAARRAYEVRDVIAWARKSFGGHGRRIYLGDVNSPAGSTTRPDDVGPVFKAHGYHDLGLEAGARVGRGRYHLDRAFGGDGVEGTRVVTINHGGSDHPATYIEFTF